MRLRPSQILTFTTDFGDRDGYVAQMKGVALCIESSLRLVDVDHGVSPHAIESGAYVLETSYRAFPRGTVHVAVVDPGVGGPRRAIAVETERCFFVGPDNGLLDRALLHERIVRSHRLTNTAARPVAEASATFEGRDVFAPAAAWLARGMHTEALGPPCDLARRRDRDDRFPAAGVGVEVPVVHVDRFGNVILDVREAELRRCLGRAARPGGDISVAIASHRVTRLVHTYVDAGEDELFLLVNSAGYLEVARFASRADDLLGVSVGDRADLTVSPDRVL